MSDPLNHLRSILYQSEALEIPLFPKAVTGHELFFAVSFSKPALDAFEVSCPTGTKNIEQYLM